MDKDKNFSKYELARVLGARALQIAMDAPLLTEISVEKLEEINYDPMEIAKIELEANALPISVKRPLPKRRNVKIKKTKEEVEKEKELADDEESEDDGEIMELATPEDEVVEEEAEGREGSEELQ